MSEYLVRIEHQYQLGQQLFQAQQFEEALFEFDECVTLAIHGQRPLLLTTYADLVLSMGFCLASMRRWDDALGMYRHGVTIIKQEEGWEKELPELLTVMKGDHYNQEVALATFYDAIGLAYENLERPQDAQLNFQDAFSLYVKNGQELRALETLCFWGLSYQRQLAWEMLIDLAGRMVALAEKVDPEGPMMVQGLQFLAQAHDQRGELAKVAHYLQQAVKIEQMTGHPDLDKDAAELYQIEGELEKQKLID
jgi:tetratricopeptide (TPR) repeat protein